MPEEVGMESGGKGFDRARLRERLHHRADAMLETMFGADGTGGMVTFDQIEDAACRLGDELAAWLIEERAAADPAADPPAPESAGCPKCGKAGVAAESPGDPWPARDLTSRAGEVRLARKRFRCTACRVVFFPLGREARPDRRGLQPGGAAQDRRAGGQGPVVRVRRRRP
jgi:hypothetical protein